MAGVVGSGDLEVLLEPGSAARPASWSNLGQRQGRGLACAARALFTGELLPAASIEINDFGATPGVVGMRMEQAFKRSRGRGGQP